MAGRLHVRDRELHIFEGLLKVREHRVRGNTRRNARIVEPEPNAPLLIRIVRYPYKEETHRGRRRRLYDASRERPAAELREQPMRSAMVFKGEPIYGNPIRALDIHPAPLPAPPPVDDWLAAVGVRPDLPPMPGGA